MIASAPSTAPFSLHRILVLCAALLDLTCSVLAQTATPDYTSDLPSGERVHAAIKGSDPSRTLPRPGAVLTTPATAPAHGGGHGCIRRRGAPGREWERGGSSAGGVGGGSMPGLVNVRGGEKTQDSLSGRGAAGVFLGGLDQGPASPVSLGFGGQ